jgi:hypothetical protein
LPPYFLCKNSVSADMTIEGVGNKDRSVMTKRHNAPGDSESGH